VEGFVSGGSKQAAPIKTAIIRPTNFYDGNRRLSFGASPGSKVKYTSHLPPLCPFLVTGR